MDLTLLKKSHKEPIKNTIVDKIDHAKQIISDAVKEYGDEVEVACSFGKDSMVVVHLALQVKPDIRIFSVMTPFKPQETFEYKDKMIQYYNLNIVEYMSKETVDPDLPKTDPDECCRILKVEPTKEAVKDLQAWICGLRNTEGRTRKDYKEIEEKGGLIKINPILNWTELDIWRYLAINSIPIHPFYARGYRSLGCEPCTKLINDDALEREGRWLGTSKCGGECGIHTQILKK
ncbi:MAG: phosphoadenylyl-sulfate reductase [Candidatus Heimdallarchaeota archaeon]|nr:phosphoadenylyl-sulfate reductase [Candidatus Heimdallarchaeota archaeon]MBY8995240.1 phosphoadenylyl-sulfate reductase [Candidatus Heimdallarchaeota archaeon]